MKEAAEIRLVREVLEGVLAPRLAAVVMFEILADPLPEASAELLDVVRGRLAQSLVRRVGLEDANAVVRRLESLLHRAPPGAGAARAAAGAGAGSAAVSQAAPAAGAPAGRRLDPDATMSIPLSTRPVSVLVVAGGQTLELRLAASLGPQRVAPISTGDAATFRRFVESGGVQVVLVDATDFPQIDPRRVAEVLARLSHAAGRAVWGAELPYGRSVVRACEAEGQSVIALGRSEGIEPLLDLVRARRAPF